MCEWLKKLRKPEIVEYKPTTSFTVGVPPPPYTPPAKPIPRNPMTDAYIPQGADAAYREALIARQNASGPVDRSGNVLTDEGMHVQDVRAGESYDYTYVVRPGVSRAWIQVSGAGLKFFSELTDSVDGSVLAHQVNYTHERDVPTVPGPHGYSVSVNGSGPLAVQFQQR